MMQKNVLRIAILGTESTGKSTLAAALAAHYRTVWVPEYLREFVETRARTPQAHEQFSIATTQVERENKMTTEAAACTSGLLFCDTTPLITAIYSGFYFDGADAALTELANSYKYDFTIVTAPSNPWVADGLLRESDAVRQIIHARLMEALAIAAIPFLLVDGDLPQRLDQVMDFLLQNDIKPQ